MKNPVGPQVLLGLLLLFVSVESSYGDSALNADGIERAMGLSGQTQGDIFKISLPRTDLSVSIDGVSLKPRFALGSWVAFKPHGNAAVAHGDLVLLEKEVGPVMEHFSEG
ncbi:MAG: hypothetical protein NVS9B9_26750 [Ktedonobacteraceae bacterium]